MNVIKYQKKTIKNIFRYFGFDIQRHVPGLSNADIITSTLKNFKIDLVLDVGANIGQFSSDLRESGYKGNIISFEPLSEAYSFLQKKAASDTRWIVHPRCAVGAHICEIEINIAGNSVSSSILSMLDNHISASPDSEYIGKESVPLVTIDSVLPDIIKNNNNLFLKIDTQGFENEVLNGAKNVMPQIRGILLELSLVQLYEGQHLWQEMMSRLNDEGFVLWSILSNFTDIDTGRTLQVDGIFFKA